MYIIINKMKALQNFLLKHVKISISTFLDTEIRRVMTFIAILCICGFQSTSWKWANYQ